MIRTIYLDWGWRHSMCALWIATSELPLENTMCGMYDFIIYYVTASYRLSTNNVIVLMDGRRMCVQAT
jgi:hypothetical protein